MTCEAERPLSFICPQLANQASLLEKAFVEFEGFENTVHACIQQIDVSLASADSN